MPDHPIILFGGTFDPVHSGHIGLASSLIDDWPEGQLYVIPLSHPPHREMPVASGRQRLDMLTLAFNKISSATIDDREIKRKGVSYTYLTVEDYRAQFPHHSVSLLLGDDAASTLNEWRNWQQLVSQCNVIIVERPGHQHKALPKEIAQKLTEVDDLSDLGNYRAGYYHRYKGPRIDVSATEIRYAVKTKTPLIDATPVSVYRYIKDNNLYTQ